MNAGKHGELGHEPPLVTAIMAVFNGETFLATALDSVVHQDYPRFEFIVCDDGSTDASPEILASYPAIRVVRQPNLGVSAARNAALALACGEFIAIFDADDLWPRNRLSVQVGYLLEHPSVGCVLGHQEWIDPPPWLTPDLAYDDLGGIPVGAATVRREVMDVLDGFDPAFRRGEDTDLLIRMRGHGIGFAVQPETILYRRFHGGNLTADGLTSTRLIDSLRAKLARERAQ